jgi:hypothetical protein
MWSFLQLYRICGVAKKAAKTTHQDWKEERKKQ